MAPLLTLLTDYQYRRLVAQWYHLLPTVEMEAARRAGRGPRPGSRAAEPDEAGAALGEGTSGTSARGDGAGGPASLAGKVGKGQEPLRPEPAGVPASPAADADSQALLAKLRAASARERGFLSSPRFVGVVPGRVFKLDSQGLGYYPDTPPNAAPLHGLAAVRACLTAVLRAGLDHVRKQERGGGSAAFADVPLPACEARLDALRLQARAMGS